MNNMNEQAVCARFQTAVRRQAGGTERGTCVPAHARFILQIGVTRLLIRISDGRVEECTSAIPLCCATDFVIRAPAAAWHELWEQMPKPGRHDIFALVKSGDMQIEGDMQRVFASLQYFKDLFVLPRHG